MILEPVTRFGYGALAYWRGVKWLMSRPGYLVVLFLPMLLGLLAMIAAWGWLISRYAWVSANLLYHDAAAGVLMQIAYALLNFGIVMSLLLATLISFVLITNVLASPIYEWVSLAVERDLYGSASELSFMQSLRLLKEELKKALFIALVSVLLLLIPVINVLGLFVTAFLVGWDFYDFPLSRRGWSFGQRLQFVLGDLWAVAGFGIWMVIPFAQFILMPMAIVGGTILNLERLQGQART